MRIGIDLDNTLIYYDDAFVLAARERGLVPPSFTGTKQQVRDHIRTLPEGETKWQKLQGYVYGKGISHARLFDGVEAFIRRAEGHELFIVSHKTEFGHYDAEKINLRNAALEFLHTQPATAGFHKDRIFFTSTRRDKVNTIATLSLGWFIDDLVEVYEEPHFPTEIRTILFHTAPSPPPAGHWHVCRDWNSITTTLFA